VEKLMSSLQVGIEILAFELSRGYGEASTT
jgi:hypothetical protein